MLPFEECKKILNQETNKYTDEEIIIIRQSIIQLVMLDYASFMNTKRKSEDEKSNNLHKSINGGPERQRLQSKRPGRPPKKILHGEQD